MNAKIEREYGCFISLSANIHPTVEFRHPVGIVIGLDAVVSRGCVIYQGVTLGGQVQGDGILGNFPILGEGVIVYAGAKVLGKVKIGNNAVIGANSVVVKDVPENAVVGGVPARVLKYNQIEGV